MTAAYVPKRRKISEPESPGSIMAIMLTAAVKASHRHSWGLTPPNSSMDLFAVASGFTIVKRIMTPSAAAKNSQFRDFALSPRARLYMEGMLPSTRPMKQKFNIRGYFSMAPTITLLNSSIPAIAPTARGMRNLRLLLKFLKLREYMILSYILSMTAIVPPLTPGMAFAIPISIPKIVFLIYSIDMC